jgi:Icc-related predicted phosphoesterase
MIIAAVSDVHSPRHFREFLDSVDRLDGLPVKPHLFLIAGDMVQSGDVAEYEKIYNALWGKVMCPIVACFGNNEYTEKREAFRHSIKNIRFLDDQVLTLDICEQCFDPMSPASGMTSKTATKNVTVGIVGTTGSLETPTPWQLSNVPNVAKVYEERIYWTERQLQNLRTDIKILLMHYAPTYKTLEGENPRFFGNMGWNIYENVLIRTKPTIVIHGHSHHGIGHAWIDSIPIYNSAIQVNGRILIIDTDTLKPGLARFVK